MTTSTWGRPRSRRRSLPRRTTRRRGGSRQAAEKKAAKAAKRAAKGKGWRGLLLKAKKVSQTVLDRALDQPLAAGGTLLVLIITLLMTRKKKAVVDEDEAEEEDDDEDEEEEEGGGGAGAAAGAAPHAEGGLGLFLLPYHNNPRSCGVHRWRRPGSSGSICLFWHCLQCMRSTRSPAGVRLRSLALSRTGSCPTLTSSQRPLSAVVGLLATHALAGQRVVGGFEGVVRGLRRLRGRCC